MGGAIEKRWQNIKKGARRAAVAGTVVGGVGAGAVIEHYSHGVGFQVVTTAVGAGLGAVSDKAMRVMTADESKIAVIARGIPILVESAGTGVMVGTGAPKEVLLFTAAALAGNLLDPIGRGIGRLKNRRRNK